MSFRSLQPESRGGERMMRVGLQVPNQRVGKWQKDDGGRNKRGMDREVGSMDMSSSSMQGREGWYV